ncbi:MAG: exodeoxyribonuclease 7 large subunit [Acidimicrobiales bacterium]|nr:MAG: exodeoxyribonuclease 7 large subunit [Acidimicrobiales bacterium]
MADDTFTVGELNELLREGVRTLFPEAIWVQGEIGSLDRSRNGHVFFELHDPPEDSSGRVPARINVVLLARDRSSVNRTLREAGNTVRMRDGLSIRIKAFVDVYAPAGRLQLRMVGIDPTHTLGELELRRLQTIARLEKEGLRHRNARLPFPPFPYRIGLVTAEGSAAEADFLHELEASGLSWNVLLAYAAMQGADCERSVRSALLTLEKMRPDAIAVVRGGGARTDLAVFDSELLARTVALLDIPVVVGIGHETDRSVLDEVAHVSCKTPTAAAAHLVSVAIGAVERAEQAWEEVRSASLETLRGHRQRIESFAHSARSSTSRRTTLARQEVERKVRSILTRGVARLAADDERISGCGSRVAARSSTILRHHRDRVGTFERIVSLADPARQLARGWSLTYTRDGKLLRSPADVEKGDDLVTIVAAGRVSSTVTGAEIRPTRFVVEGPGVADEFTDDTRS